MPAAASQDPGSAPPVTPASVTARSGPARAEHPRPGRAAADLRDGREDRGAARVERDPGVGDAAAHLRARRHVSRTSSGVGAQPQAGRPDPARAAPTSLDERWDVRVLTAVDAGRRPNDRTHVDWERGLGSVSPARRPGAGRRSRTCCASGSTSSATTRRCGGPCRRTSARTTTRAATLDRAASGRASSISRGRRRPPSTSTARIPTSSSGSWVVLSKPELPRALAGARR